jgi:hypothetical protein
MRRILSLCVFIFLLSGYASAQSSLIKSDSLLNILKKSDAEGRQRDLVLYLRYAFDDIPVKDLPNTQKEASGLLKTYHVNDREGLNNFIDVICKLRENNYTSAQNSLTKAIDEAGKNEDHYLLYACFTHLGFLQNDRGNEIDAISAYRAAKKEATLVNDPYMQTLIDINLSDIYYKNRMYGQAMFFLNEAQSLTNLHRIKTERTENTINYNKAEAYYQSRNIDSLRKYNELLNKAKSGVGLYTFQKRTDYYLDMLGSNYPAAIKTITTLQKDSAYQFDIIDERNLAEAYFGAGQLDSAKSIAERLINNPQEKNHYEVNLYYYKLLGDIEDKRGNNKEAAGYYKMALSHALEQLRRSITVSNVSSQIRIDQIENSYIVKAETFKRERLWLIFIISMAVLLIIIGSLFYYSIHKKKYYEKLLFEAKKNEIAFINSHEVRRHASNIMGIMQVINQGEDKYENFMEAEKYLLSELANLDNAIKNVSNKLNS